MIGRSTPITVDSELTSVVAITHKLTCSNPSDEVVEWFWKIVKAWPAERKVSTHCHKCSISADDGSLDYYNSPLVLLVSPSMVSRIYKDPTVLDGSLSKKLVKSHSCPSRTPASTELICLLTRRTRHWSRS
jgi:hypothetical protein